jgi:sodium-dependent dicarboxylate transporter 2/3/5
MLVLWVAGNWVPQLNVVMVALIGSIAMFLPGVDLLRWRELQPRLAWDVLLLIGGVTSIAAASVETGLAEWLVTGVLGGMQAWSPVAAVAAISAFTVLVHLVVPIGPVINALLIPPIVLLAREAGVNPAVYALPVAFSASASFLLPIDPVPLLTYSKGYYRMLDMLVPGLVLGALWVVWLTVLVVGLAPRLGLG